MNTKVKTEDILESRLGEEAFSIERVYFTKTSKKISPKKKDPFIYLPGSIPILVSAPHSVRHERKKKIKVSDEFTGSIAYLLNRITNCHTLAVSNLYGGDPNYDYPCIYKSRLKKICEEQKIKFIIDIHGAAREHSFDIDLGTMEKTSLLGDENYLQLFKKSFQKFRIDKISDNFFSGITNNTIVKFASQELRIPAIQIEINRQYRVPHQNSKDYCRLLAALSESISIISLQITDTK